MPNYEHNIHTKHKLHQIFETIMEKCTAEPAKVHLNSDMETIRNHLIIKKNKTDTELSKEYWRLKQRKLQPQVQFYILKKCRPTKRTGICYLCLNEKLFIIEYQGNDVLTKRNEFISKYRHKNKLKHMNHKT